MLHTPINKGNFMQTATNIQLKCFIIKQLIQMEHTSISLTPYLSKQSPQEWNETPGWGCRH